ncbi:MAG: hypothetical protein ACYTFZ_09960 [Planctomycetota bacterium]|jgi:hypothetical protein
MKLWERALDAVILVCLVVALLAIWYSGGLSFTTEGDETEHGT